MSEHVECLHKQDTLESIVRFLRFAYDVRWDGQTGCREARPRSTVASEEEQAIFVASATDFMLMCIVVVRVSNDLLKVEVHPERTPEWSFFGQGADLICRGYSVRQVSVSLGDGAQEKMI